MDFQNIQSKSDAFKCPRCHSLHTKFCYYNNYNYSQPRHLCKTCCHYWTLGGLLRNVPVGGETHRSKKNSKSKAAIVRDSPPLNSAVLRSNLEMFSTPLKLNQAGDWCGWIENGRELDGGIVGAAGDSAVEGSGSSDHLATSGGNEGMVEISGGVTVDGGSWFKFYELTAPFNN